MRVHAISPILLGAVSLNLTLTKVYPRSIYTSQESLRTAMALFFLLVLKVFSLILTPSEAVVYYVTPTEPPNPDCPGQPCQTLNYYFSHKEEYFNSSKINVTMLVLNGQHILSRNHTECTDNDCLSRTICGHLIKDLEIFEMIGLESACDVVVQLYTSIFLTNITKSHFASLTFFGAATDQGSTLYLVGCILSANTSQLSQKRVPVESDIITVTVVNGTIFSGVTLIQATPFPRSVNFSTTVANSQFDHRLTLILLVIQKKICT